MSLFTSFNTGVTGLHASRSGMNTTAHNLANADTVGYTRQQNINTDTYYNTLKVTTSGRQQIGYGTTVSQIRQIRDTFLDKEYRLEVGRQSFYEQLVNTENEVEDLFGETEGVEFQSSMQNLWDILENLSTNPESITNRQLFISRCDSFLETAKNVYSSLSDYQTNLNTQISSQVDAINGIGEKIALLNSKILIAEASEVENANDYRDARNQLMDELAEYTNFTSAEDTNGTIQIYINNAPFVMENRSFHMGCERISSMEYNEETEAYDTYASEMYKVKWTDNGYGDVYDLSKAYSTQNKTDVGSLLGILTARGNFVGNYSDIPVEPSQKDAKYYDESGAFDETQYKIDMNTFQSDLREYNNITANSVITKTQAQFDKLINGVVSLINNIFCPNTSVELSGISGTDASGASVSLADGTYKVLDLQKTAVGADDNTTIGTEVFQRSQIDRYQKITLSEQVYQTAEDGTQVPLAWDNGDGTYTLYVYNEEDTEDIDTMYTLQSMKINNDLIVDYALLPVISNPVTGDYGAYDMTLYPDLLEQWNDTFAVLDPNTLTSFNFDDFYSAMIGDLGSQGYVWQSMVDSQTSLTESIESKRQQIAGVSTDEEMVNLLTYQHAYNAASRYITTVDSMLGYLIERLG